MIDRGWSQAFARKRSGDELHMVLNSTKRGYGYGSTERYSENFSAPDIHAVPSVPTKSMGGAFGRI